MAIVQISRITNRKGLQENLPQLAGAELGWSIDERRLFIGNGTLQEGAPVVGNTEILTEFSDIFQFQSTYTYKGAAAGYIVQTGPDANAPVTQSLQSWLDQWASVKDFGAVGDGVTDDTDAINRALYQLYCREVNPQIRRSLFFPAGVYSITQSIIIPPYATLYGEGIDNSIIQLQTSPDLSSLNSYVARTGDSLQQTGVNIGNNGAITPRDVTITNMAFETVDPDASVFLVDSAIDCQFQGVSFIGPLTQADLDTDIDNTKGVDFNSTASIVCSQIVFDKCAFGGTTWAVNTNEQLSGIVISKSKFNTLYQGVLLGTVSPVLGGATGFRIVENIFDNVYAEGVIIGTVSLNASGYNIFYDVGNHFNGTTNPETVIIDIQANNNLSVGDMFERGFTYSTTYPRIRLNNTASIAFTDGERVQYGRYRRNSGLSSPLVDNTVSPASAVSINAVTNPTFCIDYTITRDTAYRTGRITASTNGSTTNLTYSDDYTENTSTGITLSLSQASTTVSIDYTSTSTGQDATFVYSLTNLS